MTVGTKSNPTQIIQAILDVPNQAIKTTIVGTQVAIAIAASDGDSVIAWPGSEPFGYDAYSQTLSGGNKVVTTQYFSGGLSGTLLGTVVKTYSDNTRTFLVSYVMS